MNCARMEVRVGLAIRVVRVWLHKAVAPPLLTVFGLASS